jgi:hypothetical protein
MQPKRELTDRELWFRERIGKRIFRNDSGCHCSICEEVFKNGLIVTDTFRADYLYVCEADFAGEKVPLRYFDTKDEAMEFSVQQEK